MRNQRKKLFLVTTIPGSLNFFKGQLNFLNKAFDIVAISSNQEKLEEFGKKERVRVCCIPMERPISLVKDMVSLIRFMSLFRRNKPDIVHGNTPKASFLSMLAAKLINIPVRIYMCHGLRYQGYNGPMAYLLKSMERITCACATDVICVSYGIKKILETEHICKKEKLKVVGYGSVNGIDTNIYDRNVITGVEELFLKMKIPQHHFIFCFVGRIVKDKGVNELVAAFNRLSKKYLDVHLLIVGPMEGKLNSISESTKIELSSNNRIHAVGRQTDVKPYMVMSNVFVLPSYREGFGVVLMEAGALEIPCITTNITGCNEVIIDKVNGKLVPPRDENALFEVMEWCYKHRNSEIVEMKTVARQMVLKRYEQQKLWDNLLKIYQSL